MDISSVTVKKIIGIITLVTISDAIITDTILIISMNFCRR